MSEEGEYDSEISFDDEDIEILDDIENRSQVKVSKIEAFESAIESNPRLEILNESLKLVAQEHQGTITDHITGTDGEETKCDFAVTTPDFPQGVGIRIDRQTGKVDFLYDRYLQAEAAQKITEKIMQNYIAIALIKTFKTLGYIVEEKPGNWFSDVELQASSYLEKIRAKISQSGEVNIDFIGFREDQCTNERNRINNVMTRNGAKLKVKKIRKKSNEKNFSNRTHHTRSGV